MAKKEFKIGQKSDVQANGQSVEQSEGTVETSTETTEGEGEKPADESEKPAEEKPAETANNTSGKKKPAETANNTSGKKKLTDEEVDALAESLKDKVGMRVETVPFNTVTWIKGTVVAIIADKRVKKALYAIKLDNGNRVVKSYDSELIKWTDEKVEVVKGARTSSAKKATSEELLKLEEEAVVMVGRTIKFSPFGGENKQKIEGIITSIVPDTRSGRILYKIESVVDGLKKTSHKVSTSADIEMTETFDEKMNAEFVKRREARAAKTNLTTEEKIKVAEDKIKKIAENRKKLDELEAITNKELEELKAKFEKEAMASIGAEEKTEEAPAENDDMMS